MIYDLGDGCSLHGRDEWGGARAARAGESRALADITTYAQHRTSGISGIDTLTWVQNLYDFHVHGLGYADIAYHLIVDQAGDVWEGRGWSAWSATDLGHNPWTASCVLLRPTGGAAMAPLSPRVHVGLTKAYLLASWTAGHPLTQRAHSDLDATKACPGSDVAAWIHAGGLGTLPRPHRDALPAAVVPVAPAPVVLPSAWPAWPLVGMGPGSRGARVAAWQKRLNQVQLAALRCDGRFGPKTKTATAAFQRAKGLEQSGAVDRQTWEAAR